VYIGDKCIYQWMLRTEVRKIDGYEILLNQGTIPLEDGLIDRLGTVSTYVANGTKLVT
jgi:hypothetical protein